MLPRIKHWLEPPRFEGDEEKTSQARISNTLIIYLGAALLAVIFVLVPLFAFQKIGSWIIAITIFCGLVIGRHLLFKGRFQLGSTLVFSVIYLCILAMLILSGGSSGTAMFYFATVVLVAGYFLDARVVNGLTIATFLIAMGISFLQERGLVVIPKVFVFNSVFSWVATGMGLLFMIRTRDLFVGDLKNTLALARQKNTLLQRTEQSLRESEMRYKSLFENNYTVTLILDPDDGAIVDANPAACDYYGWSREELLKKRIDQINTLTAEEVHAEMQLARAEKRNHFFFKHRRSDGSIHDVEVYSGPLVMTGKTLLYSIVHDITERQWAEKTLRESEARFSTIFHSSPVRVSITRLEDGLFLDVNEGFLASNGYVREEVIGHTALELSNWVNPADGVRLRRLLVEQGPIRDFEAQVRQKSGQIRDVLMSADVVELFGERCILSVGLDITERKRGEEALQQSEKKYRELFQVNKDGIAIFLLNPHGPPGAFVELNDAAPAMLGYTRDEMLNLTPQMFEPHTTQEQFQFRQSEIELKGNANFETVLLHKNGQSVFAEFTAQLIQYEGRPAVMNIVRDVTERRHHEIELHAIATLSAALRAAETRAEMLPVMLEQMVVLLNCEAATIEIIDPLSGDSVTEVAHGVWKALIGVHQKSGTGMNEIISQTRQAYTTNDLDHDPNFAHPDLVNKGISGCIGAPLIAQDNLIGFVWMGRRKEVVKSDVRLLAAIADITANAIYRATLHERTQKHAADLARAYDTTLEGWVHALELRDQETEGHTRRVTQLTGELAHAMGIGEDQLENIRRGALLHDIGKMGISDSILRKAGGLDEREWEIMRQHPEYAYRLLEPIDYLRPALDIPYCHHERWDGTGYPRNLKGEEIPLAARIFAVVDVWDALTSNRPYRPAWTKQKALAHIAGLGDKHFDPQVLQAFLKII